MVYPPTATTKEGDGNILYASGFNSVVERYDTQGTAGSTSSSGTDEAWINNLTFTVTDENSCIKFLCLKGTLQAINTGAAGIKAVLKCNTTGTVYALSAIFQSETVYNSGIAWYETNTTANAGRALIGVLESSPESGKVQMVKVPLPYVSGNTTYTLVSYLQGYASLVSGEAQTATDLTWCLIWDDRIYEG